MHWNRWQTDHVTELARRGHATTTGVDWYVGLPPRLRARLGRLGVTADTVDCASEGPDGLICLSDPKLSRFTVQQGAFWIYHLLWWNFGPPAGGGFDQFALVWPDPSREHYGLVGLLPELIDDDLRCPSPEDWKKAFSFEGYPMHPYDEVFGVPLDGPTAAHGA